MQLMKGRWVGAAGGRRDGQNEPPRGPTMDNGFDVGAESEREWKSAPSPLHAIVLEMPQRLHRPHHNM